MQSKSKVNRKYAVFICSIVDWVFWNVELSSINIHYSNSALAADDNTTEIL